VNRPTQDITYQFLEWERDARVHSSRHALETAPRVANYRYLLATVLLKIAHGFRSAADLSDLYKGTSLRLSLAGLIDDHTVPIGRRARSSRSRPMLDVIVGELALTCAL